MSSSTQRSGDVAEEHLDDVKHHPVETMAATFALGVVVGRFVGWFVARR